jgi:hypothetical protein
MKIFYPDDDGRSRLKKKIRPEIHAFRTIVEGVIFKVMVLVEIGVFERYDIAVSFTGPLFSRRLQFCHFLPPRKSFPLKIRVAGAVAVAIPFPD